MKYCLIDVNNMIHRARWVQKTHVVEEVVPLCLMTVMMSMSRVYHKFGAEHMVACFDHSSWRKVFYEEYKGHRRQNQTELDKRIEESINNVIANLKEFLDEHTNVTTLQRELIEADDFIARWIVRHPHDEHIIVSSDGDFKQLVADNVTIYNGVSNELTRIDGIYFQDGDAKGKKYPKKTIYGEIWKQKLIKTKTEITDDPVIVEPEWEKFMKVMKGDKSDNIPPAHLPRYRLTKIREAYEKPYGEQWAEMMSGVKDRKLVIRDPDSDNPEKDFVDITVQDHYERNMLLVDLTGQPTEIVELIDIEIDEQIAKPPYKRIGYEFVQYCGRNSLIKFKDNPNPYVRMLGAKYNGQ